MTAVRTRRTETGYKAVPLWVRGQWTPMPNSRPDGGAVDSARPVRKIRVLPWEVFQPVGILPTISLAIVRDGLGEVSRGHSRWDPTEGLKLCLQEAGSGSRSVWCARQILASSGCAGSTAGG
jgi:hypothetical protein